MGQMAGGKTWDPTTLMASIQKGSPLAEEDRRKGVEDTDLSRMGGSREGSSNDTPSLIGTVKWANREN